jgi:hypothetical protein
MTDEEWALNTSSSLSALLTGANQLTTALFWMGFSGSPESVPPGGTCPRSSQVIERLPPVQALDPGGALGGHPGCAEPEWRLTRRPADG